MLVRGSTRAVSGEILLEIMRTSKLKPGDFVIGLIAQHPHHVVGSNRRFIREHQFNGVQAITLIEKS